MKPEPLKGKEVLSHNTDFDEFVFYDSDIKSAVEWREKEFRRKIAEMILKHMQGKADLFSLAEICDLSKEVTNKAFEDVTNEHQEG